MPLNIRDNRVITLVLRDGAPTIGELNALQMSNAGGYFTEPLDVGTFIEMLGFLLTTAHGGTSPTLDVNLQYSSDKVHWVDSGDSFAQVTTSTGDGVVLKKAFTTNFGKYIRFRLLIAGTATPTYTVTLQVAVKG